MANLKQWVNLPKESRYVGDGISSEERLDFLYFKHKFKTAKPASFKVSIVPSGSGNIKYSKEELKRHAGFRLRKPPVQVSTSTSTPKVEQEMFLPAAGGNTYKVKAKYNNKVVESTTTVEVWRRLYYEVISMYDPIKQYPVPYLSSMSGFENAFVNSSKKFNIELKEKGNGRKKMKFIKTIHNTNHAEFRDEARKAYTIDSYYPYAVAVVFSNFLADYVDFEVIDTVSRSIPSKLFHWGAYADEFVVNIADIYGRSKYIWEGLDDDHDKTKFWLFSATFVAKDGRQYTIPKDDVTITGAKTYSLGGYKQVKVSLKNIPRQFFSSFEGTIQLKVNILDGGFTGGFSYTNLNLITVGTLSWWDSTPSTNSEMLQTLNHEMGHKVGMVGYGDKDHRKKNEKLRKQGKSVSFEFRPELPDAPKTLYGEHRGVNNQGHLGPHCGKGAKFNNNTGEWSGKPGCVMFGSNATEDPVGTYNFTPATFCDQCEPVVRKLDLNGTLLSGLKKRF
ncbi:MAG: hypothetical protein HY080_01635 [Gammaproteobacteria bacterium]|nr:hypothetical protein [Gammaproteobacteria bacterium]